MKDNLPEERKSSITVNVDVTQIVKYVCISGIVIVGIIFGTNCCQKILESDFFNQK